MRILSFTWPMVGASSDVLSTLAVLWDDNPFQQESFAKQKQSSRVTGKDDKKHQKSFPLEVHSCCKRLTLYVCIQAVEAGDTLRSQFIALAPPPYSLKVRIN